MGIKAGKIWGNTELVHANGVLEFHRIEYNKGFKCSEHEHQFKWNGFFVESGKMLIRVWQDGEQKGLVDETILEAGDFTQVSYTGQSSTTTTLCVELLVLRHNEKTWHRINI